MNNWNFVGNIARDCETRHTPKGDAVTGFTVAVNSGYGDKAVTTWASCNLWGKQAESLAPYLLKGSKVAVCGELTLRKYTNKEGIEQSSLDVRVSSITLLGSKGDSNTPKQSNDAPQAQQSSNNNANFDEDIPF